METSKIFFSVVVPTYNRADSLNRTISSVLSQTYTYFELLIMDDGSTDNTSEIVQSFGDSRIQYDWAESSGGPAKPRNRGIYKAKGDWICFLDADDVWYEDKLESCLKFMNKKVDIIYHDLKLYGKVNFIGRKILRGRALVRPALVDLLINGNAINNSSVVVRKKTLDRVNYINESPDMIASEDYNLWLKIAEISEQFLYIPKVLGGYFVGEGNISNKNMAVCLLKATNAFFKYLNDSQFRKCDSRIAYMDGRYMYLNREYCSALKSLAKVVRYGSYELRIKALHMILFSFFKSRQFSLKKQSE